MHLESQGMLQRESIECWTHDASFPFLWDLGLSSLRWFITLKCQLCLHIPVSLLKFLLSFSISPLRPIKNQGMPLGIKHYRMLTSLNIFPFSLGSWPPSSSLIWLLSDSFKCITVFKFCWTFFIVGIRHVLVQASPANLETDPPCLYIVIT